MHYQEQSECQTADNYFTYNLQNAVSEISFQGTVYYNGGCQWESAAWGPSNVGDALAGGTCYVQVTSAPPGLTTHQGVGWCNSDLDEELWDGDLPVWYNGQQLSNPTASDCWTACQAAYGAAAPFHEFFNDGEESWCYCQDGCQCMEDVGESNTLAPADWVPPCTCGDCLPAPPSPPAPPSQPLVPFCGCEEAGQKFCNYDYGPSYGGFCEMCPPGYAPLNVECYSIGLPAAGAGSPFFLSHQAPAATCRLRGPADRGPARAGEAEPAAARREEGPAVAAGVRILSLPRSCATPGSGSLFVWQSMLRLCS